MKTPAMPPAVATVFKTYPPPLRAKLMALRKLILDTAAFTDGVGPLDETLKWNQPSYLTAATGAGTTVRIDRVKSDEPLYAIYFHCQSGLVDRFRELYPQIFRYEGNRAIVFDLADKVPEAELRHCIGLALTHHARKKTLKRAPRF